MKKLILIQFLRQLVILLLLIIISLSCNKNPIDPVMNKDYTDDFLLIWNTVDQYYPFLEFKKINWDSIYTVYCPQVKNVNKAEIKEVFNNLIMELKDGHANLIDENGVALPGYLPRRYKKDSYSFDFSLVKQVINIELTTLLQHFHYGVLHSDIGYIYLHGWWADSTEYSKFDAFWNSIENTNGLIIDIRHNIGGDPHLAIYFLSHLISSPIEGKIWTKKGGGFYPPVTFYPDEDYQYTKPVILLTNGVCYSSSEFFADLLKNVPHATVIGDTTGGGAGVSETFTLPCGLKFQVPTSCGMRLDGEHLEWNGVPPDIHVPQTKEDIENNHDKQLEYAIDYINKNANERSYVTKIPDNFEGYQKSIINYNL